MQVYETRSIIVRDVNMAYTQIVKKEINPCFSREPSYRKYT